MILTWKICALKRVVKRDPDDRSIAGNIDGSKFEHHGKSLAFTFSGFFEDKVKLRNTFRTASP